MDMIRRLLTFALVLWAIFCVLVWACYFAMSNPFFGSLSLPLKAEDFPGSPMVTPLIVTLVSFAVAYFIYPPNKEKN